MIYTLTLSPAYDVHIMSEHFGCGKENHARIISREAGGKGLNISRALSAAGIASIPIILLGKENDGSYREAVRKLESGAILIPVKGQIRENMTVHDEAGRETRICFDAPALTPEALQELRKHLDPGADTDADTWQGTDADTWQSTDADTGPDTDAETDIDMAVTFTGRMPAGVSKKEIRELIRDLKRKGVKTVIDSKSFDLNDLKELGPWLIKPNREEISEMLGCEIRSREDVIGHGKDLLSSDIGNILVTLGAEGAVLFADGHVYAACGEPVTAVSTIGAGDSAIAGFLAAEAEGLDATGRLRSAVAFGTAACLTPGTQPPSMKEVERIRKSVTVKRIS